MAALIKANIEVAGGRGVQRKVFRIERMFDGRMAARPASASAHAAGDRKTHLPGADDDTVQSLKRELALLYDAIARNRHELAVLIGEGRERHMAHAAGKLGAAVDGMEKATVKILKSAEAIDESARALTATLKDEFKRGLAQDIQDHVVNIYEACNFQDLSGQRIGNVIETLNSIEDQVEGMLGRGKRPAVEAPTAQSPFTPDLLNGPRLDGDSGHTSQDDIDMLFD
jgi:chemotaxis protein CheZ